MTDTGRIIPPRIIHQHPLPLQTGPGALRDAWARSLVAAWRTSYPATVDAFKTLGDSMAEGTRASLALTAEFHRWAVLKRVAPVARTASARKRARYLKWRTTTC